MKIFRSTLIASLLLASPSVAQIIADEYATAPYGLKEVTPVQSEASSSQADMTFRFAPEVTSRQLSVQAFRASAGAVEFRAYSNYSRFIGTMVVQVTDGTGDVIANLPVDSTGAAVWANPTAIFNYRLIASNGERDDYTRRSVVMTSDLNAVSLGALNTLQNTDMLVNRAIRVRGTAVQLDANGMSSGDTVFFGGQQTYPNANGSLRTVQFYPRGGQTVYAEQVGSNGRVVGSQSQVVSVPDNDFFAVGLIDATIGNYSTSGPIEEVTGEDFSDEYGIDGQVSFYIKRRFENDWTLTTSVDTGDEPIDELFTNFLDRDPRSILNRLDPDDVYPVYGDDSVAFDDAPTDGKLYFALEKNDSIILWGNFKNTKPDTILSSKSRALYGGLIHYEAEQKTASGKPLYELEVFSADPGTQQSTESFRGTGGINYYLRNRDILYGSERVWIETRDAVSGVVLDRRDLIQNDDYSLNAIQGRITLNAPLASTDFSSGTLINGSTGGNPQFLVVTYEYSPNATDLDEATVGGSIVVNVTDTTEVGVNVFQDSDGAADEALYGAHIKQSIGANSYIMAEVAQSENSDGDVWQSIDGGYSFDNVQTSASGSTSDAYRLAADIDLADFGMGPGELDIVYQHRDAGFSAPGQETDERVEQIDLAYSTEFGAGHRFALELSQLDSESRKVDAGEFEVEYRFSDALSLTFGARHDDIRTIVPTSSSALNTDGERTDAALRFDYSPSDNVTIYGYAQETISKTGSRVDNNRYGIGTQVQVTDRLYVSGEISDGSLGEAASLNLTYAVSDTTSVYTSYSLSPNNEQSAGESAVTYGVISDITDNFTVYAEQKYYTADESDGNTTTGGFDWAFENGITFGMSAETGWINDATSGDLDRDAVSASVGYAADDILARTTIEYRKDDGDETRETFLFKAAVSYKVNPDWRMLAEVETARSTTTEGGVEDSKFTEATLGFAYRPVANDNLNLLFKYQYLYDNGSPGQVDANGDPYGYAQRSDVISVDGIYQVSPSFAIGAKYAHRFGELRDVDAGTGWQSSDASLYVLRGDWNITGDWYLTAEGRYLDTPDAGSSETGYLAVLSKKFGDHIRVGIGYNSTDFSDDLTDQSYTAKGPFLNISASF